jgi:hypothetical protein
MHGALGPGGSLSAHRDSMPRHELGHYGSAGLGGYGRRRDARDAVGRGLRQRGAKASKADAGGLSEGREARMAVCAREKPAPPPPHTHTHLIAYRSARSSVSWRRWKLKLLGENKAICERQLVVQDELN